MNGDQDRGKANGDFEAMLSGDPAALDRCFAQHATALRLYVHYSMGRLRDIMETVDVVQEVYIRLEPVAFHLGSPTVSIF